jgi:hypothetical protein
MKKYLFLLTLIAVFGMETAVCHATCVATGEISRVSVNPGSVTSSFYVIESTADEPSYSFETTDGKVVSAVVLAAQASHMTVQVTGGAGSCGTVMSGVIAGGTVVTFTTAP